MEFRGAVSGALAILGTAGGLGLLHTAAHVPRARALKVAGWLFVAAGVGLGACTLYCWAP